MATVARSKQSTPRIATGTGLQLPLPYCALAFLRPVEGATPDLQKTRWRVHEAERAHVSDAIWEGVQNVRSATCADALHLGAGHLCFALSTQLPYHFCLLSSYFHILFSCGFRCGALLSPQLHIVTLQRCLCSLPVQWPPLPLTTRYPAFLTRPRQIKRNSVPKIVASS